VRGSAIETGPAKKRQPCQMLAPQRRLTRQFGSIINIKNQRLGDFGVRLKINLPIYNGVTLKV